MYNQLQTNESVSTIRSSGKGQQVSLPVDASFNKLQQWSKNENTALMVNVDKSSKIQYAAAPAEQQGLKTVITLLNCGYVYLYICCALCTASYDTRSTNHQTQVVFQYFRSSSPHCRTVCKGESTISQETQHMLYRTLPYKTLSYNAQSQHKRSKVREGTQSRRAV